ncbi:hypothetical protein N9452_09525 [Alphaproteobacteria bacterium]|nr:hypothetical protein [Alphaproteobacteria bacterium]
MSGPIKTPPSLSAHPITVHAPATPNATLVQLPRGQSQLQTGQILTGMVTAQPANGQVAIQIPSGQMVLQTTLALPPGTQVTVSVQTGGKAPQIQLHPQTPQGQRQTSTTPAAQPATSTTSVNAPGLIALGSQVTAQVAEAPVSGTAATSNSTTAQVNVPPTVQATGITPAGSASPILPTGFTVLLKITSITPPQGMQSTRHSASSSAPNDNTTGVTIDGRSNVQTPPRSQSTITSVAPPASNATTTGPAIYSRPITQTSSDAQSTVPPAGKSLLKGNMKGNTVEGRPITQTLTGAQPTIPSVGKPLLNGNTTGTTIDGRPVVQTPSGTLTLKTQNPIPIGTRLSFEVIGTPRFVPNASLQPVSLIGQWQTMQDAIHVLQSTNPTTTQALGQSIPQPGPQLTASLLFFLSAITSGDIRKMLGEDASRALEQNSGLFKSLQEDARQLQRMAADGPAQEWRSYLIPLLTQTGLEQIKFSVHAEEDDENEGSEDSGTHFIIEVLLKRMGRVQFDGRSHKKSVHLLMRSQNPVPEEIRPTIQRIYVDTLSALGFTGTLAFQQSVEFNTTPTEETGPFAKGITV